MSNSVLITVVAAIVLVLATPLIAKAQQVPVPTAGEATWSGGSILTDQDLWVDRLGVNSDRNYTMGVGFQFNGAFVKRLPDAKLHFLLDRGVSGLLGAVGVGPVQPSLVRGTNNIFERNFHGITFAASGFTPDELTAVAPVIGDRPYGSIVVLSTQRMFVLQGPRRDLGRFNGVGTRGHRLGDLRLDPDGDPQAELEPDTRGVGQPDFGRWRPGVLLPGQRPEATQPS